VAFKFQKFKSNLNQTTLDSKCQAVNVHGGAAGLPTVGRFANQAKAISIARAHRPENLMGFFLVKICPS